MQQESLEDLEEACRVVKHGLVGVKSALATLQATCATLEAQAEQLESDILLLTTAICRRKSRLPNQRIRQSSMAIMEPEVARPSEVKAGQIIPSRYSIVNSPSEIQAPQPTPQRLKREERQQLDTTTEIDKTSVFRLALPNRRLTRSSKRSSSDPRTDGNDVFDSLKFPPRIRKPHKRVKVSETEDLPISNIRTPPEELIVCSESDELILPIPKAPERPQIWIEPPDNTRRNQPILPSLKMYIHIPRRRPRSGPQLRHTDGFSTMNMVAHSRTKTRWDASSGKRIPVIISVSKNLTKSESGSSAG